MAFFRVEFRFSYVPLNRGIRSLRLGYDAFSRSNAKALPKKWRRFLGDATLHKPGSSGRGIFAYKTSKLADFDDLMLVDGHHGPFHRGRLWK